ncbi:hypothetical protein D1164_20085 [Mariniphaga sediminis]|jgi:hypothetical protein|uniref:Uncharacterized protein n=1 Tax=Mariniphaga sediminis TaxID=1628158 RepID=A0A399CUX1_9BACT|nr:hypothetical protein [Mariniphaga sediminis]RIH63429.1 hypothetical protein D1164_20085 [Mariniphaga sediminis]
MENISTPAELKEAIQLLEAEKSVHLLEMKGNFFLAYESLKPANLIKSTMKEIGSSPYLFNNIFNVTLGLVAGYLSKRALMIGRSNNKSKKLLGLILQLGVTNLVVYAPNAIKSFVQNIFQNNSRKSNSASRD